MHTGIRHSARLIKWNEKSETYLAISIHFIIMDACEKIDQVWKVIIDKK